jgi:hypothetical protein
VKRLSETLLFLLLLSSLTLQGQSQPQRVRTPSAKDVLRQYVEARLRWAHWKDFSRFITWPDEPGWDCWWVAKDYNIGKVIHGVEKTVITVTYDRLGLFCADLELQAKPGAEPVSYELVKRDGAWKVDSPTPDYPYISARTLVEFLTKTILDPNELPERKTSARRTLEALRAANIS